MRMGVRFRFRVRIRFRFRVRARGLFSMRSDMVVVGVACAHAFVCRRGTRPFNV